MDNVLTEKIKGVELSFKTRPGVFSKGGLDLGSKLLMENVNLPSDKRLIADLGCGSGIIGLFAAKLAPATHVHLLDVNLRFIELARENAELNNLSNVEVYLSDQFSAVESRTYQLILSNPAQHLGNQFLEETASECFKHLKIEGEVYWVIQKHMKSFIVRLFEKYFQNATIVVASGDYIVVSAQKN